MDTTRFTEQEMQRRDRQWRCTVCGYVHQGAEPPENCPRCGAERERFVPLEEETRSFLRDLVTTAVPHLIVAHFPVGLIPTALLLYGWSWWSGGACLDRAAGLLVLLAAGVVPISIATGLHDWRHRFHHSPAPIFRWKLALAAALLVLAALFLLLAAAGGGFVRPLGWQRWAGGLLLLAMLPLLVLLGHFGAKLALQWRDRED